MLGFLEPDFRDNGGASGFGLGKAREGFGSGGNFWRSFQFFPPHSQSLGILSMGKPGVGSLGIIPA